MSYISRCNARTPGSLLSRITALELICFPLRSSQLLSTSLLSHPSFTLILPSLFPLSLSALYLFFLTFPLSFIISPLSSLLSLLPLILPFLHSSIYYHYLPFLSSLLSIPLLFSLFFIGLFSFSFLCLHLHPSSFFPLFSVVYFSLLVPPQYCSHTPLSPSHLLSHWLILFFLYPVGSFTHSSSTSPLSLTLSFRHLPFSTSLHFSSSLPPLFSRLVLSHSLSLPLFHPLLFPPCGASSVPCHGHPLKFSR